MDVIHLKKADLAQVDGYQTTYCNYEGNHPTWVGRRCSFLPGHGTTLFVEGVHFVVDDDPSHLPVLTKENAEVGLAFQSAGGMVFVHRIYQLTEETARAEGLYYLDRVETSAGDFALPGGDMVGKVATAGVERV